MIMFKLPDLPYEYDSLAPYISADIQHLHHTKHHATYVKNLNDALASYPEIQNKSIEEILTSLSTLPEEIKTVVRNNGGGHYNHSQFWQMMHPKGGGDPTGSLKNALENQFGDIKTFKEDFSKSALKIFGSGWQWLVLENGKLTLTTTPNQDSPLSEGKIPLLGLDVWEHAYYLQYYNKRPDYIEAWWNIVHWEDVAKRLSDSRITK